MPREKYPVPITSSQVYGWDSEGLFRIPDNQSQKKIRRRMSSNNSGGGEAVFIKHTLEQLVSAKEAKKIAPLLSSSKQALGKLCHPFQNCSFIQNRNLR